MTEKNLPFRKQLLRRSEVVEFFRSRGIGEHTVRKLLADNHIHRIIPTGRTRGYYLAEQVFSVSQKMLDTAQNK